LSPNFDLESDPVLLVVPQPFLFGDEKAAAPFARRSSSFPSDFFLRKKKNIFHLTGRRDSQKRQVLGAEEFWRRSELRFGPGSQISGGQRQTNRDSQTEASG